MTANAAPTKICFSGFPQQEKTRLKELAIGAGMVPVGTVSRSLGYLVAGPDCGPQQHRHASEYGIPIIDRNRFESLLRGETTVTAKGGEQRPLLAVGQCVSMPPGVFVAIDFETADRYRDSACAVALVRIENGVVASEAHSLIRPPRDNVEFAHVHGLTWDALRDEKPFADVWTSFRDLYDGADYFIAHNAVFDKAVLAAGCGSAAIEPPSTPFVCTLRGVKGAITGADSYCLSNMCEVYGIPLNRHEALSDAKAAAQLFSKLLDAGVLLSSIKVPGIKPLRQGEEEPVVNKAIYSLIKEFLNIAKALVCDGVLTEGEMAYVLEWMDKNAILEDSPFFAPLFELAWRIVEDDVMTDEELDEMKIMLERWIAFVDAKVR